MRQSSMSWRTSTAATSAHLRFNGGRTVRGLSHDIREFEAESVAYLVCLRCGIDISSEQYLSGFLEENEQVPPISLERVMKAAGLIESMSQRRMKPRKPSQNEAGG